jgi:hypothetical protein
MKKKSEKIFGNFAWWLGVVVVGISLGLALQFVRAWTEPTAPPPEGNVGAPINISSVDQTKGNATSGKINAADFCLNSDPTKCLSTAGGGGGGIFCGNGTCDTGETCSSCAADCGDCPCQCWWQNPWYEADHFNVSCGSTMISGSGFCYVDDGMGGWISYSVYCYSTCLYPGVWHADGCPCP